MKHNAVKRKLQSGKPSFGTWLSLGNVMAARFMARTGLDWLTVDLEHSPIDWETAAILFGAIADAGCTPLARVPCGDHDHIKRVLDSGAMGIVAPMVNSVEQAKAIIAATKYPPVGNRSVGGALHALNYGGTVGDYFEQANDEILVVLQTEHPLGVQAAREIYALPGVDAIFVGPNDLRANMRQPDGTEATAAEFNATMQKILDAGKSVDTPVGLHVQTAEAARERAEEGWQFIAIGSELKMMITSAQQIVTDLGSGDSEADLARY